MVPAEGPAGGKHREAPARGSWAQGWRAVSLEKAGLRYTYLALSSGQDAPASLSRMQGNEALQGLGRKQAGVQERSGSRFQRCFREGGTKLWGLPEVGGRAGPPTPSLQCGPQCGIPNPSRLRGPLSFELATWAPRCL